MRGLAHPEFGAPITTMELMGPMELPLEPMKLLMEELLKELMEQKGLRLRLSLPLHLRLDLRTGRAKCSDGC